MLLNRNASKESSDSLSSRNRGPGAYEILKSERITQHPSKSFSMGKKLTNCFDITPSKAAYSPGPASYNHEGSIDAATNGG